MTVSRFRLLCFALSLPLLSSVVQGQGKPSKTDPTLKPSVPFALKAKVDALGDRFTAHGKERITMSGSIQRPNAATASVTVVYEIPLKFRYEEGGKVLTYDGNQTQFSANPSAADVALLESLFDDSSDGVLFNAQHASLIRPLINRARLDDGKAKTYTGPYLDVFQFVLPVSALPGAPRRTKHFYFDSKTHLLDRVRYFGGANGQIRVETLFQSWQGVNGTFVPTVITHSEAGVTQFTLNGTTIDVGPSKTDNAFSQK